MVKSKQKLYRKRRGITSCDVDGVKNFKEERTMTTDTIPRALVTTGMIFVSNVMPRRSSLLISLASVTRGITCGLLSVFKSQRNRTVVKKEAITSAAS